MLSLKPLEPCQEWYKCNFFQTSVCHLQTVLQWYWDCDCWVYTWNCVSPIIVWMDRRAGHSDSTLSKKSLRIFGPIHTYTDRGHSHQRHRREFKMQTWQHERQKEAQNIKNKNMIKSAWNEWAIESHRKLTLGHSSYLSLKRMSYPYSTHCRC